MCAHEAAARAQTVLTVGARGGPRARVTSTLSVHICIHYYTVTKAWLLLSIIARIHNATLSYMCIIECCNITAGFF